MVHKSNKKRPTRARPVARPDEMTLDEAWVRYKEHGDLAARDFIAKSYKPLVERIARSIMRKKPAVFDYADLVQSGTIGLLNAIDKYSLDRGVLFSTFAPLRIRGAIYDDINELDWTPRSVRERIRAIIDATDTFESEHGRSPSAAELAEVLQMPIEKVREGLHQKTKTYISTVDSDTVVNMESELSSDEARANFVGASDKPFSVEEVVAAREDIETLASLIESALFSDEARVIRAYYYEGKTMREIAETDGVSVSRISSLRKSGIAKLREILEGEESALLD